MQQFIDLFLMLRRASLLASADEHLHPVVRHHLSITELNSYAMLLPCPDEPYATPDDAHLTYPLTATGCVGEAYRIALAEAANEPGVIPADMLWALASLHEELMDHDACRGDELTQHALAEHGWQVQDE